MSNTNVVVLTGNLGDDVDHRVMPQSETSVAEIRIAVNKHRPNQEGGFDTFTAWVPVKFFGNLADRAKEKLAKGAKVAITGELAEDTWVDKNSGQRRNKLYVVGSSFEPIGGGAKASQDAGAGYQDQSRPQRQQANRGGSSTRHQGGQQARQSQPPQQQGSTGTRPQARPAGY
ncbi:MAG: single-stranded DNA-binding protein [gamma proteobacterium symbiont of Clathrolucina costata]